MNLYAHYILLIFLRKPNLSLQETSDSLNTYSNITNDSISWHKSSFLPLQTTWMWKPTHHLSLQAQFTSHILALISPPSCQSCSASTSPHYLKQYPTTSSAAWPFKSPFCLYYDPKPTHQLLVPISGFSHHSILLENKTAWIKLTSTKNKSPRRTCSTKLVSILSGW